MKRRLAILGKHNLKLADIQAVIARMVPLEGALEFLNWLRSQVQLIIVSDTYIEFAGSLMEKLDRPTLFCNTLSVADDGSISDYILRQPDGKQKVAQALKTLNYRVIAIGDSYNDITMLQTADHAILYRPPDNVKEEFVEFPTAYNYRDLKAQLLKALNRGKE